MRVRLPALRSLAPIALLVVATSAPRPAAAQCPDVAAATDLIAEGDHFLRLDLDEAIGKYEAAHRAASMDPRPLAKLARAFERREAWSEAAVRWSEASALVPKHAGYVFGRGHALARLERWTEALAALEAALVLDERRADAHELFAQVVLHLVERPSRDREAATHLRRAIELSPDDAGLYVQLGEHMLRLGFGPHATATAKAGLERARDGKARFPLLLLLAKVAEDEGDLVGKLHHLEAAKAAMDTCANCDQREHVLLYFLLGMAYARSSPPRTDEAEKYLKGFVNRICRGRGAARHVDACEAASRTIDVLRPTR